MDTANTSEAAAKMARMLQIVVAALMLGVTMFGGVVVTLAAGEAAPAQNNPLFMVYVGAGFAAVALIVRMILPNIIATTTARQAFSSASQPATVVELFPAFQVSTIVANALLEGVGFFNLIAYQIERQMGSLAIVGGLLAIMAATFPTKSRLEDWAANQLTTLELDQTLRPQN
jgi:hypothetical protein